MNRHRTRVLALIAALALALVGTSGSAAAPIGEPTRAERPAPSVPAAPLPAPTASVPAPTAPGPTRPASTAPLPAERTRVVYRWPIGSGTITRPFDNPAEPWLAGHRGVDLAGVEGEQVVAAADGTVAFAGSVAGKPVVSIDHADGLRTTYEPVLAGSGIRAGASVQGGTPIGTLVAGHGTGSDLHWGARRGPADYVDPAALVTPPPVIRLHPLTR